MSIKDIEIRGARTHNLKNINLTIPRDKLIVITGLSGSGKSSLAFDTLYAEGQRRYVESLSAYARQFLSLMEKPDVDHIDGLSPAISIEQKSTSHNPRSTVGTITEIYDYLRLLFARIGEPKCPEHNLPLKAQTISQMVDAILALSANHRYMILAPVIKDRKGEYVKLFEQLAASGYIRVRVDGEIYDLSQPPELELHKKHTIEVVVDRFSIRDDLESRLAESLEAALDLTHGIVIVANLDDPAATEILFSANFACPVCGYSIAGLEPRLFSFNNPSGACPDCDGLGIQQYFDPKFIIQMPEVSLAAGAIRGWDRRNLYYFQMLKSLADHYAFDIDTPFENLTTDIQNVILNGSGKTEIQFKYTNDRGDIVIRRHPFEGIINNLSRRYRETDSPTIREELAKYISYRTCSCCKGSRLCLEARNVFIENVNLPSIAELNIHRVKHFFDHLKLTGQKAKIADKILKKINDRLQFLINVGLGYLNLSRSAETLSGGEAQRIRLASQIGAGLVGVMYVLDEPSIGLHQRDNSRLINTLIHLRDLGNTVIVVEHDEEAILAADYVIDVGPGAGVYGGSIVASGTPVEIMANPQSLTGKFLSGKEKIAVPKKRKKPDLNRILSVVGATGHNLKNVNLNIPIGLFTCITGVSGSGKSTLINNTLYPLAQNALNDANNNNIAPYKEIRGLSFFDKVINIDQSPIGRTPRSNPATYTGFFTSIRELYSGVPEARARGYTLGRFSFNVKGGRCEACQGDGLVKVEMHFLPDIYVSCDECHGKRYNRETLEIKYKGKAINEILDMTVEEGREFFDAIPIIKRKLQSLVDVGLSYITLGQPATTLSGGEAQRVKLSKELSKRDTGNTLYILDEPTTGLHFTDVKQLLNQLHLLRDKGNTIVVIEHNLDVIKTADWIIDLGPEGGSGGGEIVAEGSPEKVADVKRSYTGCFLKPILERGRSSVRDKAKVKTEIKESK